MKEKIFEITGSVSGVASVLGSWQVCHSICIALISLLSIMGIAVNGMPLVFFTKIALPIWIIAVILFVIIFLIYLKKPCISKNLLILNAGLIIAGTPFKQEYSIIFWIIGGLLVLISIILFIKQRFLGGKK